MTRATMRILFAGAFALVALTGAVGLEFTGEDVPQWLVAVIFAAAGYIFGHAQENGLTGNRRK